MSDKDEISSNDQELLNMSRSELIADFSEDAEILSDVDDNVLRTEILQSKSEFVNMPLELPGISEDLLTNSYMQKKNLNNNENIFKSNYDQMAMKTKSQFQNFTENEYQNDFKNNNNYLQNDYQNNQNFPQNPKNAEIPNKKNEMVQYYKDLYEEEKSKNNIFETKISELNKVYLNSIDENHKSEKTYQLELLELRTRINQLETENSNLMQKLDIDTIRDQNEFKRDLDAKENYLKEIQKKIIKFEEMIESKNDMIENLNKEIYDIKNKENDTISQFEIELHKIKISLENSEIKLKTSLKLNLSFQEDLDLSKKIINELKNELIKAKEFNFQLEANLEYNKQLMGNLNDQNSILIKEKEKMIGFNDKRNREIDDLQRSLTHNIKFEAEKVASELFKKKEQNFGNRRNQGFEDDFKVRGNRGIERNFDNGNSRFGKKKEQKMSDFLGNDDFRFGAKKNNFEETGPMNPFADRDSGNEEKRGYKRKRANLKKNMEMKRNNLQSRRNLESKKVNHLEDSGYDNFGRRKNENLRNDNLSRTFENNNRNNKYDQNSEKSNNYGKNQNFEKKNNYFESRRNLQKLKKQKNTNSPQTPYDNISENSLKSSVYSKKNNFENPINKKRTKVDRIPKRGRPKTPTMIKTQNEKTNKEINLENLQTNIYSLQERRNEMNLEFNKLNNSKVKSGLMIRKKRELEQNLLDVNKSLAMLKNKLRIMKNDNY